MPTSAADSDTGTAFRAPQALVTPLQEASSDEGPGTGEGLLLAIAYHTDHLLRNRALVFDEISRYRSLPQSAVTLIALSLVFSSLYGVTMGLATGWTQALVSAVKVPVLLGLSLGLTVPALAVFNTLLGSPLRAAQTVSVALCAAAVTAIVLGALAPVSLFLGFGGVSLAALKLFNVAVFLVAGYFGAFYLYDGLLTVSARLGRDQNVALLQLWLCGYAYIACHLAWTLRPFVGVAGAPIRWLAPAGGSFFSGIQGLLTQVLG